jgi:hypothetical protein
MCKGPVAEEASALSVLAGLPGLLPQEAGVLAGPEAPWQCGFHPRQVTDVRSGSSHRSLTPDKDPLEAARQRPAEGGWRTEGS